MSRVSLYHGWSAWCLVGGENSKTVRENSHKMFLQVSSCIWRLGRPRTLATEALCAQSGWVHVYSVLQKAYHQGVSPESLARRRFSRSEGIIYFLSHFADFASYSSPCCFSVSQEWELIFIPWKLEWSWWFTWMDKQTSFWNQPCFQSTASRWKNSSVFISLSTHLWVVCAVKMCCGLECVAGSTWLRPSAISCGWSQHTGLEGPAIASPMFLWLCSGTTDVPWVEGSLQAFAGVVVEVLLRSKQFRNANVLKNKIPSNWKLEFR